MVGTSANAGELDVGAYLREVGLAQALEWEPTVRTLTRLQRAHLDAFAFADVTTALGGVPRLDLATLEQRMVKEHRGGYCLEHVTLFAAVLEALGFACALRLGRVGDGSDETRPATHLTVLAQPIDDGRRWLADVRFGLAPRGPLPVPQSPGTGVPVRYGGWEHRVDLGENGRLSLLEPDERRGWRTLHVSGGHDAADDEISRSNRWVALEPDSPFAGQLIALRSGDERRERLVGTRFEVIAADGEPVVQELSPSEATNTLEHRFGVTVDDHERAALLDLLATSRR